MAELKVGDHAPDFELKDASGETVRLSDFKGRKLLVYFYPKADTPGCTAQACSVRDAAAQLARAGITAVGISPDQPQALAKFDRKHGLGFPLLSDADHVVAEAWGAWGEKTMYGKKYFGIIRSAFLVDAEGRIAGAWYKIKPEDTVPNALAAAGK